MLAEAQDIVFIFYEVKAGIRLDIGVAKEHFGMTLDLTVCGKGFAKRFALSALRG